jgi:AcrR family transcriptional regulator
MTPTRSEVTRRRIIVSAARVMVEQGYERATMLEIARRAGVTTGAVYFHFAGKKALLDAVVASQNDLCRRRVEAIAALEAAALEKILRISAELADARRPRPVRDAMDVAGSLPWLSARSGIHLTETIASLLKGAIEEGDILGTTDVQATAQLISDAFVGIAQMARVRDEPDGTDRSLLQLWRITLVAVASSARVGYWLHRARILHSRPS